MIFREKDNYIMKEDEEELERKKVIKRRILLILAVLLFDIIYNILTKEQHQQGSISDIAIFFDIAGEFFKSIFKNIGF